MRYRLSFIWFLLLLIPSCRDGIKEDSPQRTEYIRIWQDERPGVFLDNIQIPFEGVTDGKIHVNSNVALEMSYNPGNSGDWFTIKSVDSAEPGHSIITYDAASMLPDNSLERRHGNLRLVAPDLFFGKFLNVQQGYDQVWSETFDANPGNYESLSGVKTWSSDEISALGTHFYDYLSFNAWAEAVSDVSGRNLTVDVTVGGGPVFEAINRTVYSFNVPVGSAAAAENIHFALLSNGGARMSPKTTLTFSVHNPAGVTVKIANVRLYKVSEEEIDDFLNDDEDYNNDDEEDWI